MKGRRWRLTTYLAAAALIWCVGVGLLLYFMPLGSSATTSSTGVQAETRERIFALSLTSLWPLIVPALLCAVATWAAVRHHRRLLIAVAVVLAAFTVLALLSIGLAYVPAVVLLVVGAVTSSPVRRAGDQGESAAGTTA